MSSYDKALFRNLLHSTLSFQILQCGGNLFDAVGIAVKAALHNTEIPKVIAATLDGSESDIQISDDLYDCVKLNVTNYPVIVTVCKVCINSNFLRCLCSYIEY